MLIQGRLGYAFVNNSAAATNYVAGTRAVSMFSLKLAHGAGLRVVLSSSSDKKIQQMREKFLNPPILTVNYATNPDWHNEVLEVTAGVGVDIVVENGVLDPWSRV